MISWQPYILSILICSLSCGIVSAILSDTKRKNLMHLICGVVMTISVISPLTRVKPEYLLDMSAYNHNAGEFYITEGKNTAIAEQKSRIIACCESYILDKAKALSSEIEVTIHLDEMLVPAFAEIRCQKNEKLQHQLQEILEKDLGIPKENQTWIWNQENNSS